jgi:regulator of cell morphogenesis and NO signaling
MEEVVKRLQQAEAVAAERTGEKDWRQATLTSLIEHITRTHHAYVRQELPRIGQMLEKVVAKHGPNHPEVVEVAQVFRALAEELGGHLLKEEQILFPYITQAEACKAKSGAPAPSSCFGTVQNPIRMMMFEHDNAGAALRELRQLSGDYTAPADACATYQALYQALAALEADLHQHIHLENNLLFPRAVALEGEGS